jgi:hypothetical protein
MKTYLNNFFTEFDYPVEAREALTAAYETVIASTDTADRFNALIAEYDKSYSIDYTAALEAMRHLSAEAGIHEYTGALLLFLCYSKRLEKYYEEAGIDRSIFVTSMYDLKYKLIECHLMHGVWGSFVASWFPGFFTLNRFALGRLQFEWDKLGRPYEGQGVSLPEGTRVVNMHIPRTGEPLSRELCDDAFARATAFYAPQLQADEPLVFVCSSWLLYPAHDTILPAKSNIRGFMARFDICRWGVQGGDSPDLWRLFDTKEMNPDRLPTDSSLRRAYVDHLKKGGKTGWGYGVIVMKK